jgi:predicted RNA-binding Zn-ribbon protein involved in translation (DUF1610 family)
MAPPITYEADGKQYVAFQGGLGRPAATVGPNDAKIDNPPMMFVFALDGKAELPTRSTPSAGKTGRPGSRSGSRVAAALNNTCSKGILPVRAGTRLRFKDERERIESFERAILIECPHCSECATLKCNQISRGFEYTYACSSCGFSDKRVFS